MSDAYEYGTGTCEACRWWVRLSSGSLQGECHLNPPNMDSEQPPTWRTDWCSKFDYPPDVAPGTQPHVGRFRVV